MVAKAFLIGRITRDLELKKTQNQKSVVSFSLACDNGYGENKQTSFIECVAWNQLADNLCAYQQKGSLIALMGNINTRNYEKDGRKVYITEVVADSIKFIGANSSSNERKDFNSSVYSKNENELKNDAIDYFNEITNDDLPF